jgi:RHS repeat-associated protein
MQDNNNELYDYIQDHLGSPIQLFASNEGNAIPRETYSYGAFGEEISHLENDNLGNSNLEHSTINETLNLENSIQPFGYTGYQSDEISGTYFAQAREYQPQVANFISEDPIRRGDNWYQYCNSNPLKYIDPLGLDAIIINKEIDAFIGIEHMSGFFQDEKGDWYYFFWGPDVKVEKVDDPSVLNNVDSINKYLYDHNIAKKPNGENSKPYKDAVYIEGDFSLSVTAAQKLKKDYENTKDMSKDIHNVDYGFFTNNCTQATMKLFALGVLPNGKSVEDYLREQYLRINGRPYHGVSVIPNLNMNWLQVIFGNSSSKYKKFKDMNKE